MFTSRAFVAATLLAAAVTTHTTHAQTVLVNTGPGSMSTIGAPAFGVFGPSFQYLGIKFTLSQNATIGLIEGWMQRPSGTINVKIRANTSNLPGAQLFTAGFAGSSTPVGWSAFSGLNWSLTAGTYWVTFEPVSGTGSMPTGAATALQAAFLADGNPGWSLLSMATTLGLKITSTAPPADIHVPDDYDTIQEAIDAAATGQTVIVAPGTYAEAINFNGKAITVRGNNKRDDVLIDATGLNASAVRCVSGEGSSTVLENFVITGGAGTVVVSTRRGGGMYCLNSSPTVRNCTFIENSTNGLGGGMQCTGGSANIVNCQFIDNSSINGGGVSCTNGATPTLTDCYVYANNGIASAGGMYNSVSSPTLINCTFEFNTSGTGGGVGNFNTCNPHFTDCTFLENIGSTGGAVYNSINCDPHFTDCTFTDNIGNFVTGGIASFDHSDVTLTGCVFEGNDGGIAGGAVYNGTVCNPVISGCEFRSNFADQGGAIDSEVDCLPQVTGSLFCENDADHIHGPWTNSGSNTFTASCDADPGDADGNGQVNVDDLVSVILAWGGCPAQPANCPGDVNHSGAVDVDDLVMVILNWG